MRRRVWGAEVEVVSSEGLAERKNRLAFAFYATDDNYALAVLVFLHRSEASPLAVLVYAKLALSHLQAGRAAAGLAAELRDRFPHDPLTAWVSAHEAMAAGRCDEAVPLLEGLARVDGAALIHPVLACDERLFDELAAHQLGLGWFHLGDDARAEHWFARAMEADPDVDEHRLKRQLVACRAAPATSLIAPS